MRLRAQFRLRTLMVLVLVAAIGIVGFLESRIAPFRREWKLDQLALAEVRAGGGYYSVSTRQVGPAWLRRVAGPSRARSFQRVNGVLYVASDCGPAASAARKFDRHWMIIQD